MTFLYAHNFSKCGLDLSTGYINSQALKLFQFRIIW